MFTEFKEALSVGDIQGAVSSTAGTILIIIAAAILLLLTLIIAGKKTGSGNRIKPLVYSGVAIAIATVLSMIKVTLPQGGSVTFVSMLFIVLIGYFYGVRQGVVAGIVYGLLQLILNGWVMHPVQLLLDYPLAFGALGLSGIFVNSKNGLMKGLLIGIVGRFICHFIAGVVFFAEYAPEGISPTLYSFIYNFSYVSIEGFITIVILTVPAVTAGINRIKKEAIT